MKGLLCYIFKDKMGDSSNGGISSHCDRVILIGGCEIFEANEKEPAIKLVRKGNYVTAVPVFPPGKEPKGIGPMFGGTFVHTCDSRFGELVGHNYPVPLHDRWESPELNRMLSI